MSLTRHHRGSSVRRVRFGGENLLFSASKTVKIYDLDAGKSVRKIVNGPASTRVYSMAIVDNHLLCTGDDEGTFRLWDYRAHRPAAMEIKECQDFISDFDIDSGKKIVLASSGEGTLTSFNIRAKKMDVQSELFNAGLTAVNFLESRSKVIVGAEDGFINIFNLGEYGICSDKYPIHSQVCIESIGVLSDSIIAVGSSDGHTRILSILPNKQLSTLFRHEGAIESISVQHITNKICSTDSNVVKVATFTELEPSSSESEKKEDSDDSDSEDTKSKGKRKKTAKNAGAKRGRSAFFNDLIDD